MSVTDSSHTSLPRQQERVCELVQEALRSPASAPAPQLIAALFDFHAMTRDARHLEDAGEIARSLASLLQHCAGRAPNVQELPQIQVLLGNLLHELAPESKPVPGGVTSLVTPVAPSSATANRRVMLLADNAAQRSLLVDVLTQAGFLPIAVDSPEKLAASAAGERPVAIVFDLSTAELHPSAGHDIAACRRRFSPPPHLLCFGVSSDVAARLEAVRLGATRFLPQPVDTTRLLSILKGVTRQAPVRPFRVVVVEDDPLLGALCRNALESSGMLVSVVADALQAPARVAEFEPDIIVSDLFMPGCNGFELITLLRQDDVLADTPIVLLSSEQDMSRHLEALELGADAFLTKPLDPELLVSTVLARARRARRLKRTRTEYLRLAKRVRELESYLPSDWQGDDLSGIEFGDVMLETINLDDYVVRDVLPLERKPR